MDYVVAKDFKTVNRRFTAGMPITPEEVLGRVTFDVWMERGFIKEASAGDDSLADEPRDENTVRNP